MSSKIIERISRKAGVSDLVERLATRLSGSERVCEIFGAALTESAAEAT